MSSSHHSLTRNPKLVAWSGPGSTESGTCGEGCGVVPGQAGAHQCLPCLPRPFLSYQRMYYVFIYMLSSGPAWLGIILLVTVGLLPDVLKKVLCRQLWPTATERTQVRSLPSQASLFPLSYDWEVTKRYLKKSGHHRTRQPTP